MKINIPNSFFIIYLLIISIIPIYMIYQHNMLKGNDKRFTEHYIQLMNSTIIYYREFEKDCLIMLSYKEGKPISLLTSIFVTPSTMILNALFFFLFSLPNGLIVLGIILSDYCLLQIYNFYIS